MVLLTKTFKPFCTRLATKPGQLPLRVMPHIEFGLFYGALEIAFAFKVFNDTPVAVCTKRIRIRRNALREEHFDFFHQACGKVVLCTFIDAPVKFGAGRVQDKYLQAARTLMSFRPAGLLLRHCLASLQPHFDRALHTRPISRVEFGRALWIQSLEQTMKAFDAPAFPQVIKSMSEILIGLRALKEWVTQRAQVESGATHQYR
jgi:hypothetical protein